MILIQILNILSKKFYNLLWENCLNFVAQIKTGYQAINIINEIMMGGSSCASRNQIKMKHM